jgi:hypothetical protein
MDLFFFFFFFFERAGGRAGGRANERENRVAGVKCVCQITQLYLEREYKNVKANAIIEKLKS